MHLFDIISSALFLRTVVRPLVIVLMAGSVGFAFASLTTPGSSAKPSARTVTTPIAAVATSAPLTPATPVPSASTSLSLPADPAAGKSLRDKLNAVLRPSNHFESAAKALALIDAMTPEDFRELREKPSHFPIPSVYGFDQDFSNGLLDALIARWLIVEPSNVLTGIRQIEEALKKKSMAGQGSFSAALARLKPEIILDALPDQASWERFDTTIPNALTSLAERDVAAAQRYLERIADPELRKSAEVAIAKGIAKNDPVAVVALAHILGVADLFQTALVEAERIGPGILRQALVANDGKFPIGHRCLELMFRYPDEDWQAFLSDDENTTPRVSVEAREEVGRLTPAKREALLEQLERMPDAMRRKATEALIYGWARNEPQAALEWAVAHANPADGDAPETERVGAAFYPWFRSDEAAAVAWWKRLAESPLRSILGNGVAQTIAARGEYERALSLFRPLPGPEAAMAAATIARAGAERDPSVTARWLDTLPAEVDIGGAAGGLIEKWIARDSVAAAQWVEAQPAGARRDAIVQAYTSAAAVLDPAAAGEWAATIGDPRMRLIAAENVFREMNRRDPSSARAWLRALPGVEGAWCERMIRLQP